MCLIDARPVGIDVFFLELFERRVRENRELLVCGRICEECAARFLTDGGDALRLHDGLFGDLKVQVVGEQHVELDAEQTALGQHAAALLDVVAEIGLDFRVCDDDCFAEQRAHLRAADVEHIAQVAQVAQRHVIFRGGQPVAEPRAVDEEVQSAARADVVQRGQLRFGV